MIDLARDGGFGSVVLSSSTTMRAAHRLYERLGFVRLPERDWTPGRGIQLIAYEPAARVRKRRLGQPLPHSRPNEGPAWRGAAPRRSCHLAGSTSRRAHRAWPTAATDA